MIGNWTFAGAYTAETGELGTRRALLDANLNGDTAKDRVVINPRGDSETGVKLDCAQEFQRRHRRVPCKHECRYVRAQAGVFPNAGRNILQFPGSTTCDISISKNFNISEHKKILIRADATNV